MNFRFLTAATVKELVDKLTPRFIGRDQDHLLSLADVAAEAAYERAAEDIEDIEADLSGKVDVAGDIMTGPLTVATDWESGTGQSMGLHVASGTLVMGSFPPDYFYWNNTYSGNSYLTMDKLTADNDASLVFTEGGRCRWEFGATTQAIGDPANLQLKRVLTPTADAADDQFLDVFTCEYPSGNMWVNRGYQFWVGAEPTVADIMFSVTELFDAPDRRVTAKIQNWNAIPSTSDPEVGSQSSCLILSGVDSSWVIGNDVGLDGGNNFFLQEGNAVSESFRLYADQYGVAINGTFLNPTEAFRVNSKAGTPQGFMPPSLTTAARDLMGSKDTGLLIFNTDANTLQIWDATADAWSDVILSTSGLVVATITNGDTTHAPSGDAVFDALAANTTNNCARANHTGTQAMATISDLPVLESGTYTPTLTNVSNVAASAVSGLATYMRVGSIVTVSGVLQIDPTAGSTASELGISLPIASAFTSGSQCAGTAAAQNSASLCGGVSSDPTNDRATLKWVHTADTANRFWTYQFTYGII